jgi:gamma-glutamylaminecyclotransferase
VSADSGPETAGRHRIFVYGTLKRGGENHDRLQGRPLGPARTAPGYRLYLLDEYPGLVLDPADQAGIRGEVWVVDDPALQALDAFEGVHEGLYERVPVSLLPPYDRLPVWTYLYRRSLKGRTLLGDEWPVPPT